MEHLREGKGSIRLAKGERKNKRAIEEKRETKGFYHTNSLSELFISWNTFSKLIVKPTLLILFHPRNIFTLSTYNIDKFSHILYCISFRGGEGARRCYFHTFDEKLKVEHIGSECTRTHMLQHLLQKYERRKKELGCACHGFVSCAMFMYSTCLI